MYGTAGDSLEYHNNMKFTTKDHDNDSYSSKNCALTYDARGGRWYKSCYTAQLASTYKDYYHFQHIDTHQAQYGQNFMVILFL